ncbi:MAG: protein translocase subunit SecD, partial [Candidatus Subteraquimicrobiales bacterium]|nr:protein translocase subunit SecD [Candidatus Subteraquimicrobiales bacterium]
GARKFDEVAKKFFGNRLAIVLDGEIISAPVIQATEFRGKAQITGKFTADEARELVLVLKTGALPVELEVSEYRTVGPTLGRDSLLAGLKAGLIGLGLVALFMLGYYRLFGFLSWIGLAVFASLLSGLLVVVGATLTLPGIAGIILMIGIAADSSIIVFERIKEEARSKKTLRVAIEIGFSHGFKTFLDADLVSFITALILFYFGIGPVKGFALILMLGIICDILTSFLFTRSVLGLLASTNLAQKPNLLGIKIKEVV